MVSDLVAPAFVATLVLILDQVSKALLLARLATAGPAPRRFLELRLVLNRRRAPTAWWAKAALIALWLVCFALLVPLRTHWGATHDVMGGLGAGAALGGAAGNLVDWMRRGAIVDFIAVGPWPVFNIADAAIVVGIGLVLFSLH